MAFIILVLTVVFIASASSQNAPGQNFDLSAFKLQTPISNGNGGIEEIFQPELETYTSEYFYTDSDDDNIIFWTPVTGATTSGSQYPRTELRETDEWTYSGSNRMEVRIRILEVPSSGKIAIGQIMTNAGTCNIVEELIWENGELMAHQRTEACANTYNNVGSYAIGDLISYSIQLDGKQLTVTTDQVTLNYDYDWKTTDDNIYFKAGNYVQDNAGDETEGGSVKLEFIEITHG